MRDFDMSNTGTPWTPNDLAVLDKLIAESDNDTMLLDGTLSDQDVLRLNAVFKRNLKAVSWERRIRWMRRYYDCGQEGTLISPSLIEVGDDDWHWGWRDGQLVRVVDSKVFIEAMGMGAVGRRVITQQVGEYPGGPAEIIEILPDPGAPEIVCQVRHDTFGEIGIFEDEDLCEEIPRDGEGGDR